MQATEIKKVRNFVEQMTWFLLKEQQEIYRRKSNLQIKRGVGEGLLSHQPKAMCGLYLDSYLKKEAAK